MNKYQEAYDFIVTATNGGNGLIKELNTLKELVDKAAPYKPEYEGDGYYDGELIYDIWVCPNCGNRYEIEYEEYDYCPNCGQRLDWNLNIGDE